MNNEEKFILNLKSIYGTDKLEYIEGYKDNNTPCRFRCGNCGNENYLAKPRDILYSKSVSSPKCNKCANNTSSYGFENFKAKVKEKNLSIIEETVYINNKTLVKLKCNDCGFINSIKPNNLFTGNKCSCTYCNMSKGEKDLADFLDSINIGYSIQFYFEGNKALKYDFFIKEKNLLIEVDGKQHVTPGWGTKGFEDFTKLKNNEKIKEKLALDNKVALIRFPTFGGLTYGKKDYFLDNIITRDCYIIGEEFLK